MKWKAIGQSVTGISHAAVGKGCEDAVQYKVVQDMNGDEVLICCVSDGAGSAQYAAWASGFTVKKMMDGLSDAIADAGQITEALIYQIAEQIYDGLNAEAEEKQVELNEFSGTLLGCCLAKESAVFFQVGDGAIVRNDGSGYYIPVWWPHNGEYQNSTAFLIDDRAFGNLNIAIIGERVDEVAIFTDGLQMLTLNTEGRNVHQPFFTGLFRFLGMADDEEKVTVLNRKLHEYLDSSVINARTDDDKTLFLASRLSV